MICRRLLQAGIWITAVAFLATPGSADACGYCLSLNGNCLALPHPRAIEIAVATRAALDQGRLKEKPWVSRALCQGEGTGLIALDRVSPPQLVQAWSAKLKVACKDDSFSVHFLFIDTEHACGLLVRNGAILYDARPTTACDGRVVTTRAAFYALIAGEMDLDEAQRLGLVRVEGSKEATRFIGASIKGGGH
jgi:hypothetical protein